MKSSDDIRGIGVAAAVLDGNSYTSTVERLSSVVGEVATEDKINVSKDNESIQRLKNSLRGL